MTAATMKDLRGRVVLLTGGSRGLGPVIAEAFARRGANLALVARSSGPLESVADDIRARGARALPIAADVTKLSDLERVVAEVHDRLGPIDILVNNAGIEWVSGFEELTPALIERIVTTNLTSSLWLTRLVLPEMLERGSGHVVTISSLGGKKGSPYSATYAGTKAALIEWSQALRAEVQDRGVGVSVICPGFVAEAGMFAEYGKRAPKIAGESQPEEVADATLRAVTENLSEVIVNPGPTRLMLLANAVSPDAMSWLLSRAGVHAFYKRLSQQNAKERAAARPD